MRWSPERVRWLLLGGVFGLAAVIAALFGLSTYRAGKIWQRILARNGVHIRQESNGVTYSQSKGNRTIFTVHAGRSVPHGDGKWTLHDAVLILYGKNGRDDRISGSQFEYDEKASSALTCSWTPDIHDRLADEVLSASSQEWMRVGLMRLVRQERLVC